MSAGEFHSLALAASFAIYVFGGGEEGQLGVGLSRSFTHPQLLPNLEGEINCNDPTTLVFLN